MLPLFPVSTVYAADCSQPGGTDPVNLGECLLLSNDTTVASVYTNPAFMVQLLVRNVFVIAGMIIFLLIFYVALKMVTGGKKGFEETRTILTSALAGLVLMICAYWIVQLVGYLTGIPMSVIPQTK